MTKRLTLLAGVALGCAAAAFGQNSTTYEKTQQSTDGTVTTTTRTTFSGPIVSYEPGQAIVLREDGKTVRYVLSPGAEIPSDVAVGKVVTVTTTPDSKTVTRVVTTDTNMRGDPDRRRKPGKSILRATSRPRRKRPCTARFLPLRPESP